jgi:energy-coupling factor transporter ATP-binding protein EcfA2
VALTLETLGTHESEATSRTEQILDTLGLDHLSHRKPFTLSGGELQRVALATILVANPEVLLLDEPCNSLDAAAVRTLASVLCTFRGTATIVIADAQIDLALRTADQFVVLHEGRAVFSGPRLEFIERLFQFNALLPSERLAGALSLLEGSDTGRAIRRRVLQ